MKTIYKTWAEQEFSNADFGDRRLNKRLVQIANRLAESPESPINQACDSWAETKAAYRFFQNDNINIDQLLDSHSENVVARAKSETTLLVAQDTSYFLYTNHSSTKGLGRINRHTFGNSAYEHKTSGIVMHTAFAMTTEGLPLGILYQKIFTRDSSNDTKYNSQKIGHNSQIPIEEKESMKWIESLVGCLNRRPNSFRTVTICDREADIYDFFLRAEQLKTSILVRAKSDRKLGVPSRSVKKRPKDRLWAFTQKQEPIGLWKVEIPQQDTEEKRTATLTIRIAPIELSPARNHPHYKSSSIPMTRLHAVHVKEENPSTTLKNPLEWMLLTNIPVTNYEEAVEKVKWYCLRWKIEIFHKILKSGLKVESCRLGTADRLIRYLTVMSIIAWRIFWITLISRRSPDIPCSQVLAEDEWRALYAKIHKTKAPPSEVPGLGSAIRWIAQLGGFLGRKGDGEPGVITLWRGWKRLTDLADGWSYANSVSCG